MTSASELELKMYETYDAGYQVFLKNWQVNRQAAIDLIQKNLKPHSAQVSVLSIGAGPGDFDVQLIHSLKQQLPQELTLRYVAVEPNHLHRQRYEQKISIPEFADVDFQIYPVKIEEFQAEEKFDVIHFTHCLYYMPNHEHRLVKQAIEMLKDDGFVIITLETHDAIIFDTMFKYAALTGQGFAEMLNMEKMQTIVEEIGLSYELVNYPEYLDVRLCFEETSSQAKPLMDFFCQADSHLLSAQQHQEILQILASHVNQQDERKLVPLPAATMMIPKQIVNN